MEAERDDVLVLIDEDNKEHEFEVESMFELDGERYAVLIPRAEEYEDEAVIMRFGKDEDGEEVLFDIESDEEWERVADYYDGLLEEGDYEGLDD